MQLIREGVQINEVTYCLASSQMGGHCNPRAYCCDLRELKHVQQQHLPQKGLMMHSQLDTDFEKMGAAQIHRDKEG